MYLKFYHFCDCLEWIEKHTLLDFDFSGIYDFCGEEKVKYVTTF